MAPNKCRYLDTWFVIGTYKNTLLLDINWLIDRQRFKYLLDNDTTNVLQNASFNVIHLYFNFKDYLENCVYLYRIVPADGFSIKKSTIANRLQKYLFSSLSV